MTLTIPPMYRDGFISSFEKTQHLLFHKNSERIRIPPYIIRKMGIDTSKETKLMFGFNEENKKWYFFQSMEGMLMKEQKKGKNQAPDYIISNKNIVKVIKEYFGITDGRSIKLGLAEDTVIDDDGIYTEGGDWVDFILEVTDYDPLKKDAVLRLSAHDMMETACRLIRKSKKEEK
jgi:hypothetical protein